MQVKKRTLHSRVDQTVDFKISDIASIFIAARDIFGFDVLKNTGFVQFADE